MDLEDEKVAEEETGNVGARHRSAYRLAGAARIGGGRDLPGRGREIRMPQRQPRHVLGARVNRPSSRMRCVPNVFGT